jgi:PD-(D/E)XK nuclease superfamily
MSTHVKWSHSSLKTFETCARQYHEIRVLKKWPKEQDETAIYGELLHKACEEHIKDGVPLDPRFAFMQGALDAIKDKPGDIYCEHEMALTWELQPCGMKDDNVWVRGIADVLVIDEPNYTAWVLDYKTGNDRYADTSQLTLMSLLTFAHFPKIKRVKGALLFVLKNRIIKHNVEVHERHGFWWKYRERVAAIESAMEANNWNPKPSGLCRKHCPVLTCEHNGRS